MYHNCMRKHTRFKSDAGAICEIDLEERKKFQPSVSALILEESYGGCGLALLRTSQLQVGAICVVKVGALEPMRSEVRWRKDVDDQLIKIGIKYLE